MLLAEDNMGSCMCGEICPILCQEFGTRSKRGVEADEGAAVKALDSSPNVYGEMSVRSVHVQDATDQAAARRRLVYHARRCSAESTDASFVYRYGRIPEVYRTIDAPCWLYCF